MYINRIPFQSVRRQRVQHWLLLLLRCLAILLLVMAFTRPYFAENNKLANAVLKTGKDVIILIDGSYSMEFSHYEAAPPQLQQKLVAAHKPLHAEE